MVRLARRLASWRWAVVAVVAACATESREPDSLRPAESHAAGDDDRHAGVHRDVKPAGLQTAPGRWTFAVLSDLHLPNPNVAEVRRVIAALIDLRVRLVVITGDHTNGNADDTRGTYRASGWLDVTAALAPLREAGIPVLPVAGNHDSYTAWQRTYYATAFDDLAAWAAPLAVVPSATGAALARAPFSYSLDVDGVHLALAHVVGALEPEVARWLAADLRPAPRPRHRIVFSHVPLSSVVLNPHPRHVAQLGAILEAGRATLYMAGHEHVVWDEDVRLPGGTLLRQVLVGCSSGFYQYAPSNAAKLRGGCTPVADPARREPVRCTMPHSGRPFELARGRKGRHVQHARTTFALVSVDDDTLDVQPMTLDAAGRAVSFYLDGR